MSLREVAKSREPGRADRLRVLRQSAESRYRDLPVRERASSPSPKWVRHRVQVDVAASRRLSTHNPLKGTVNARAVPNCRLRASLEQQVRDPLDPTTLAGRSNGPSTVETPLPLETIRLPTDDDSLGGEARDIRRRRAPMSNEEKSPSDCPLQARRLADSAVIDEDPPSVRTPSLPYRPTPTGR